MIGLHSAVLDMDEKLILKDAMFLYISNLQRRYYQEHLVDEPTYLKRMSEVQDIVDKLKLSDLYR